jgi:hypothetical protein
MKTVILPPNSGGSSPAEVAGFHADRDREHARLRENVTNAVGMLGLPKIAVQVLQVGVPVLVDTASVLDRALHPEAPGGPGLTRGELSQLARGAGHELERRINEGLAHLVTADPSPSVGPDETPAPAPVTPSPAPTTPAA